MTASPAEALARELRDVSSCLRRVPSRCLRDGIAMVEFLSDLAKRVDGAAALLAPRPGLVPAVTVLPAPETKFTTGTIAVAGRMVRVERRRRAA